MKYPLNSKPAKTEKEFEEQYKASVENFKKECAEIDARGEMIPPSLFAEYFKESAKTLSNLIDAGDKKLMGRLSRIVGKPEEMKDITGATITAVPVDRIIDAMEQGKLETIIGVLEAHYKDNLDKEIYIAAVDARDEIQAEAKRSSNTIDKQKQGVLKKAEEKHEKAEEKKELASEKKIERMNDVADKVTDPSYNPDRDRASRIKDAEAKRQTNMRKTMQIEKGHVAHKNELDTENKIKAYNKKAEDYNRKHPSNRIHVIDTSHLETIAERMQDIDYPEIEISKVGYKGLDDLSAMNTRLDNYKNNPEFYTLGKLDMYHQLNAIHETHKGFWNILLHPFNYLSERGKLSDIKEDLERLHVSNERITAAESPDFDAFKDVREQNDAIHALTADEYEAGLEPNDVKKPETLTHDMGTRIAWEATKEDLNSINEVSDGDNLTDDWDKEDYQENVLNNSFSSKDM